jgi:hypothetical protein
MSNPVERIKRFIDARTGMRGLDPDIVHGINTKGEQENLTLSDLRALLADLERAEKALRDVQAAIYLDDAGQYRLTHSFDESAIDAAMAQMAGGGVRWQRSRTSSRARSCSPSAATRWATRLLRPSLCTVFLL